jgi:hypothetical protein
MSWRIVIARSAARQRRQHRLASFQSSRPHSDRSCIDGHAGSFGTSPSCIPRHAETRARPARWKTPADKLARMHTSLTPCIQPHSEYFIHFFDTPDIGVCRASIHTRTYNPAYGEDRVWRTWGPAAGPFLFGVTSSMLRQSFQFTRHSRVRQLDKTSLGCNAWTWPNFHMSV